MSVWLDVHTRRRFVGLGAAAVFAGCAPQAQFIAASDPPLGRIRTVVMATNRSVTAQEGIGLGRTQSLLFSAIDVAIPDNRRVGNSPFTVGNGAFSVVETRQIASIGALRSEIASNPDDDLTLWVHGFNNSPAEAVYRQAQMSEDFGVNGPQVAFAWPSAESRFGYLHDRDSVLHARAVFERLIRLLARERRGRITIVSHSLGSLLVMETLRQAALAGQPLDPLLSGVLLVQPDLDPDLFRAQLHDINTIDVPMVVVVDQDDPLLRLSARLSGRPRRLGASDDLDALRAMGLFVIDLTNLNDAENGHFTAATSPSAIALIRGLRQSSPFQETPNDE